MTFVRGFTITSRTLFKSLFNSPSWPLLSLGCRFLINVTGCCVSLRDFEELGMQTCIPGLVLLVRIARQHGWLLKSCARIYHTVITLSSHLAANQNKGVTCTYPGNQSGDRMIELSNHSVTCKSIFILGPHLSPIWLTNAAILTILVPN